MGCELRASLPGFRSESVNLAGRRMFDNPEVGTIILKRLANVEGTTISAIAMQAPKDAKKAFEKGRELVKKKKTDEAQKEFEKAVSLYPKYTTALFELGRIHESQNRAEDARKAYGEALAADPKYVSPYRQIAGMAFKEQKWQEVADTTDRIIKLDPVDYTDAYFYHSVANYYLKKYDVAEKSAREVTKMDGRNPIPMVRNLLGAILIEKQDYAGAAEQIREFVKLSKPGPEQDRAQKQLEQLEKALKPQANAAPQPQP
jgi:tetratricopeptide (TPR) repeat protein